MKINFCIRVFLALMFATYGSQVLASQTFLPWELSSKEAKTAPMEKLVTHFLTRRLADMEILAERKYEFRKWLESYLVAPTPESARQNEAKPLMWSVNQALSSLGSDFPGSVKVSKKTVETMLKSGNSDTLDVAFVLAGAHFPELLVMRLEYRWKDDTHGLNSLVQAVAERRIQAALPGLRKIEERWFGSEESRMIARMGIAKITGKFPTEAHDKTTPEKFAASYVDYARRHPKSIDPEMFEFDEAHLLFEFADDGKKRLSQRMKEAMDNREDLLKEQDYSASILNFALYYRAHSFRIFGGICIVVLDRRPMLRLSRDLFGQWHLKGRY
jgi:hypothetical protein